MPGGFTAPVVRMGDTVRRQAGPWTPNVHALMAGLRAAGVDVVPEPRGLDDEGREVVAYVAGDCPIYPLPEWVWTDGALRQVATALRALHDATTTLALPRTGWRRDAVEPADVVCHGDVAPYNSVWRDERLVAFIDWDHAMPAPRGWDLGYAAYRFVSLTAPANDDGRQAGWDEQRRRLHVFCEAYGGADPDDVLRWATVRLDDLVSNDGPHRAVYEEDARWLRSRGAAG
jgi:hypothetical protein